VIKQKTKDKQHQKKYNMENTTSNKNKQVLILKASGDEEIFSTDKLKRSLFNAGANDETVKRIVDNIEDWIHHGVTSKKIYTRAFSILRHEKKTTAVRYKLKQAILELGPTGFPFESLIGQLFEMKGYSTEVGVVVNGMCITHEMDVIATLDKSQNIIECKYHKDQGKQVSIQVPLYVHSRVDDIIQKRKTLPEFQDFSFSTWVITNTRFSPDSMNYSKCSGVQLLGWDYPSGNGLKENIEKYKLYPITVLTNLSKVEKQQLMEKGIVSCPQLLKHPDSVKTFDFNQRKYDRLIKELEEICK
jgi:hypothetical protein